MDSKGYITHPILHSKYIIGICHQLILWPFQFLLEKEAIWKCEKQNNRIVSPGNFQVATF